MFELIHGIPEPWRQLTDVLIAPLAWIPPMQQRLWDFFVAPGPLWLVAAKYLFLAFPALLAVGAVWCTQLSLYTLPFRSGRVQFIPTMMLTWWDGVRAVWLYWAGMFRFVGVALGWAVTFGTFVAKLLLEVIRQVALMPFTMTGRMTQSYFRPGVPWIALVLLIFWCALEAAIFTYTLMPTVTELLADLVGGESTARFTGPILYFFLLLLVMGSFACVQTLMDAVKKREWKYIVQMVVVELFVMFFEVVFLYRELIDALTPWIAQQTGMKLGLTVTLSLSAFGWIGIRGMTWFLFGQFGTPPMLAFISRRPMADEGDARHADSKPVPAWWRQPVEELKQEIQWLHTKSDELLDYLVLPVLQIAAAALNFGMVLVASRQVFSLPFKEAKEITQTWQILQSLYMHAPPRKQATL
ncbi:MAG: hypothetical protein E6K82_18175 [Candidatus Rokuibacteriota bacterium]|nr:MAG: hypothetical protein E6K82_18175 [Candidatus Rokubacteria bacterium]